MRAFNLNLDTNGLGRHAALVLAVAALGAEVVHDNGCTAPSVPVSLDECAEVCAPLRVQQVGAEGCVCEPPQYEPDLAVCQAICGPGRIRSATATSCECAP